MAADCNSATLQSVVALPEWYEVLGDVLRDFQKGENSEAGNTTSHVVGFIDGESWRERGIGRRAILGQRGFPSQ